VRWVARSQEAVERVRHEVIELDGVWVSGVDPQSGRVVVTVRELTDALAQEITRRYGTETVAESVHGVQH